MVIFDAKIRHSFRNCKYLAHFFVFTIILCQFCEGILPFSCQFCEGMKYVTVLQILEDEDPLDPPRPLRSPYIGEEWE